MSAALTIDSVSYSYRSNWTFRRRAVLKPFSLEIQEGESFGFLGHNGAGKTTTIKCILNLIRPIGGRIAIFGVDNRLPAARMKVGYIPEQPYFYDNLQVQETMWLYGKLAGLAGAALQRRVDECLERVGIIERRSSSLRALSKGLMQRVALAQALLAAPKLLILDEPFSGLDPLGRREFREIFVSLKNQGTTLFMSSHILSDVEFLCDRVSILAHGDLKGVFSMSEVPRLSAAKYELVIHGASGLPAELQGLAAEQQVQNSQMRFIFSTKESADRGLRAALDAKLSIESFQLMQGTLEELFVKLVGSKSGALE